MIASPRENSGPGWKKKTTFFLSCDGLASGQRCPSHCLTNEQIGTDPKIPMRMIMVITTTTERGGGGKWPASKAKHWTVECSGLDFHVQVGWYKAGISYLAEGQGQILLSNPTASLLTDFTVKKKPDVIRMLTEIRLGSVCRRARLVLF